MMSLLTSSSYPLSIAACWGLFTLVAVIFYASSKIYRAMLGTMLLKMNPDNGKNTNNCKCNC